MISRMVQRHQERIRSLFPLRLDGVLIQPNVLYSRRPSRRQNYFLPALRMGTKQTEERQVSVCPAARHWIAMQIDYHFLL